MQKHVKMTPLSYWHFIVKTQAEHFHSCYFDFFLNYIWKAKGASEWETQHIHILVTG